MHTHVDEHAMPLGMNTTRGFRFARGPMVTLAALLVVCPVQAADKSKKQDKAAGEEATRLQVFLDRAQFAPGKIDGHYGEFTLRALALYRQAHGADAAQDQAKTVPQKGDAPD